MIYRHPIYNGVPWRCWRVCLSRHSSWHGWVRACGYRLGADGLQSIIDVQSYKDVATTYNPKKSDLLYNTLSCNL